MHHFVALALVQVGVHFGHLVTLLTQGAGQLLDLELGGGEDDAAFRLLVAREYLLDGIKLSRLVEVYDLLADVLGRLADGYLHAHRVVKDGLCQALDLVGHGGREHEHLALHWHVRQDFLDVVEEAHVEHLVGLVENHGMDVVEVYDLAVDEVDETAGGGDDDLHSAA